MKRVLITDGEQKHALAAVRSLAKEDGVNVFVASNYKYALSFFSRYTTKKIISPHPKEEMKYINFLIEVIKKYNISVLMPIGYSTTKLVSKNAETLKSHVKFNVASWESMQIASDKDKTLKFAEEIGVLCPDKYDSFDNIDKFPIVLKGRLESGAVRYVKNKEQLEELNLDGHVAQEYVKGSGYGFYALYDNGRAVSIFMHKRIREYPATGGASTKCVSYYDEELKKEGIKLLDSLKWNGVAMVEFKKDVKDGKYKLMEINPKFWGSLDLSIKSKMPFPNLLYRLSMGEKLAFNEDYKRGVLFRWLLPDDLLHVIDKPGSLFSFMLDILNLKCYGNITLKDPLPFFMQVYETFYIIKEGIKHKNLLNKHGLPE